jgi:hypothetical protein
VKRIPIVGVVALVYLMATSVVYANAYSVNTFYLQANVPGYAGLTDICVLSGIETGPNQTGVTTSYFHNTSHCQASDQRALASGYLGTQVEGYKDGLFCGRTSFLYSTSTTHYWQVWASLCSNPAGVQDFDTRTYSKVWNGSTYTLTGGQWSPIQQY